MNDKTIEELREDCCRLLAELDEAHKTIREYLYGEMSTIALEQWLESKTP